MWRAHATTRRRRAVSSSDIMRCLCEVRRGKLEVDVNEDLPWEQATHMHTLLTSSAQKDVGELNRNTVGVGHASRRLNRVIESNVKRKAT